MRFDQLVQPILEKCCVSCHRPGSEDAKAARYDLTSSRSYENLLGYGSNDLRRLAFERDRSFVGDCPARQSKLLALLKDEKGHQGVHLEPASLRRLAVWMDLYAQRQGHFSAQQEEQLCRLREALAPMFEKPRE